MTASSEPEGQPRTSLVEGASWLLASKICCFAVTSALPFILVRRLNQTEYGYYKQLFLILQTASNLLPFGMNMSLFFFMPRAKTRAEKGNIVLSVILFYLATTGMAGVCLMLYPGLLEKLFHSAPLTQIGRQIGFTLIPYIVSSLIEMIMIANGEAKKAAVTMIFVNMARTAIILVAALLWGSVSAILSSVLIFAILQSIWLGSYVSSQFGAFWRSFTWRRAGRQVSYALPLGLAGLIWALQVDVDNYFVSHYFNAAMFAIYANGCFDVPLVGMLSDSVGAMLIPRFSALQAANANREIVALSVKAMRLLSFVYAPIFFFVFISANQVITFLFRVDYLASVPIFRINLVFILLSIVIVDPIVRAFKSEHIWMLRMNIALLILLVTGLYFATPRFGLIGAVTAVMSIQFVARCLFAWRVGRILQVKAGDLLLLTDVLKTLLAAVIAGGCIVPLLEPIQRWGTLPSLLAYGVIYTGVYVLAMVIFKVPTELEKQWLMDKIAATFPNLSKIGGQRGSGSK
jgi:O-antigen/teichoic acid export membrane protein